jgi:hypothetical protein
MKDYSKDQAVRMSLAGTLILTGIAAFVWWRLSVPAFQPGSDAILVDSSDSQALAQACTKVAAIAQEDMKDPAMGQGAAISLFRLGEASTANEPVLVGTFKVPDASTVMGGPDSANKRRQEVVTQITERCKEIPLTTISPLFEGFLRTVEFLQEQDPSSQGQRTLHAITDGEETEVKPIKQAFDQSPGTDVTLPAIINNQRVRVEICGIAETIGTISLANGKAVTKTKTRDAVRANREIEVWKRAFSQATLVQVNPYCVAAPHTATNSSQNR